MAKVLRYDLIPDEGFEEYGHAPGEPGQSYEAWARFEGEDMPRDAHILSYNISTKGVSIYALTEGGETKGRRFLVCGNDVELPDNVTPLEYRATAKIVGGVTAHVFELTGVMAEQDAS